MTRASQFRQPRVAEVVASILRERIIDGQLDGGLPKQDELLQEFRISRPSLREALRILENEGLLTVRRGNVGGSVIEVPTAEASAYTFGLVLQSRRGTIADLALAIKKIEPITAALCAERKDRRRTVLPPLRANLKASEAVVTDGPEFTRISRQFHEVMVSVCGSEALTLTAGSLASLWSEQERQWATRATSAGRYPAERYRRQVLAAHVGIVAAIAGGDAPAASDLAERHLGHSQRFSLAGSEQQVVRATALRGLRELRDLT